MDETGRLFSPLDFLLNTENKDSNRLLLILFSRPDIIEIIVVVNVLALVEPDPGISSSSESDSRLWL